MPLWLGRRGSSNSVRTSRDRGSVVTLINTDDLEKAVKLAKSHPLMRFGGSVEIGQLSLMNAGKELADAEDR
jgi:hypothetical protein